METLDSYLNISMGAIMEEFLGKEDNITEESHLTVFEDKYYIEKSVVQKYRWHCLFESEWKEMRHKN